MRKKRKKFVGVMMRDEMASLTTTCHYWYFLRALEYEVTVRQVVLDTLLAYIQPW